MRKLRVICAILSAALCAAVPVIAETAAPAGGNVTVSYFKGASGSTPITGAEFTLYKIGTLNDDASFNGIIDGIEAEDPDMILKDVQNAYTGTVSGGRIYKNTTGEDGILTYSDIELGVYLGCESVPVSGYNASSPFIVSVPVTEEGVWNYNVSVIPKPNPIGTVTATGSSKLVTDRETQVKAYGSAGTVTGNVKTGDESISVYYIILGCAAMSVFTVLRRKRL